MYECQKLLEDEGKKKDGLIEREFWNKSERERE